MKNTIKWIIKFFVTLALFFMIFTELGERYVQTPRNSWKTGASEDLFYERGKRFLGFIRGQPAAEPSDLEDACSLDMKKVKLIKTKEAGLKPIDLDLHCHEGFFSQVFVKSGKGYALTPLENVPPEEPIYIKTKGWWRIAPIKPKDLWDEIRNLNTGVFWFWIFFATVMKTLGIFSSLGRWFVLLRGQGIRLPLRYLAGTFFVGRFFGMFLPSTLGLDGYRLYDSIRQTKRAIECTAVIAVEKLIGFVALFGLVFLTLPLGTRLIDIQKPIILVVMLFILACFIGFVFMLLFVPQTAKFIVRILPIPFKSKISGKIDEVVKSTTIYSDKKPLLWKAIGLGFCVHLGTIMMYFGTMRAVMAADVDMFDIFFTSPLMITGTVFGPTIGGEGIRELVFTYLLGPVAGAAKAFLIGHLGFWIGEFLLSIPGGIVYLSRPAGYKVKLTSDDIRKLTDQKNIDPIELEKE